MAKSVYSEMTGASHPRPMFHLHVSMWSVKVCPNTSVEASGIGFGDEVGSTTSLDADSGAAEGISSMMGGRDEHWLKSRKPREEADAAHGGSSWSCTTATRLEKSLTPDDPSFWRSAGTDRLSHTTA